MMELTEAGWDRFIRALALSAKQYSGHLRKGVEMSPYINHPIGLVEVLWDVGGVRDPDVLAAALLHDTLEDTVEPGSPEEEELKAEIAKHCGAAVLGMVGEVTDDKRLPKEERRQRQIAKAPFLSPGAKLVKLADKICNVRDVAERPPAKWSLAEKQEYAAWAGQVVAALGKVNPGLQQSFAEWMKRAAEKYPVRS